MSMITALIRRTLDEDLGSAGDITSKNVFTKAQNAKAVMVARKAGVISGLDIAELVFCMVDAHVEIEFHVKSGDQVAAGAKLMTISGPALSILTAERTALNFVTHLSGIATVTRAYVDAVKGTKAKIRDTRKTLPGLRALQKNAVRDGGGVNHRMGLHDAVLIKDNHIAIAGGVGAALDAFEDQKIQIEVDTLEQLKEVLAHGGAECVLLDNMDVATLEKAVAMANGKVKLEASGGVNLSTVGAIAKTGVDYIAVGALTHSAPALDVGLDIEI